MRAQCLSTETPASLLSLQHDIERELRSERRAQRNRDVEEAWVVEIEGIAAGALDSGGLDEDRLATNEAERGAEPLNTQISANEYPESEVNRVMETTSSTRAELQIVGGSNWQAEDWHEATRLLGLDPSTIPRWPSGDIERTVLRIQQLLKQLIVF